MRRNVSNSDLAKFAKTLDEATYYRVDNENYAHAQPSQMTVEDLRNLYNRYCIVGMAGINEDSIHFSKVILG